MKGVYNMPLELAASIIHYGYATIFLLVFLQELGIPNPVPQEIILLFAGYVSSLGILNLGILFLVAVLADLCGTSIIYTVFWFFGNTIFKKKPRWLPLDQKKMERMIQTFSKKDKWGIYLWRLIPYIRGYASVAAGLLQMRLSDFLPMVTLSAFTSSGGYVIVGYLLGNRFQKFIEYPGGFHNLIFIFIGIFFLAFFGHKIYKQYRQLKQSKNASTSEEEDFSHKEL